MDLPGLGGLGSFLNRDAVRGLQKELEPGEQVLQAIDGWVEGDAGLLCATRTRLLFVTGGMRRKSWSYPYADVERIEVAVGREDATIEVRTRKGTLVVAKADRNRARELASAVDALVHPPKPAPARAVPGPNPRDVRDERELEERIVHLERMRMRGSMTEPESRVAMRRIVETYGVSAELAARALRRAKAENERPASASRGTGYEWSGGRGLTPKDPVTTADDPVQALAPAAKKPEAAARRVDVEARSVTPPPIPSKNRPAVAESSATPKVPPVQSAARKPVAEEQPAAAVRPLASAAKKPVASTPSADKVPPLQSANKKPVEVEGPLVDLGPGASGGQGRVPAKQGSLGQRNQDAVGKEAARGDEGHKPGAKKPGKPSIWPPLPE